MIFIFCQCETSNGDKKIQDFLLYEYRESWNHYRHLEKIRDNYINYFLTIAIGYFGFLGLLLSRTSDKIKSQNISDVLIFFVSSDINLVIIHVPSFLIVLIFTSFLVNIIRIKYILRFYEKLYSSTIRSIIYDENCEKINQVFYVRNDKIFNQVSEAVKTSLPAVSGIQSFTESCFGFLLCIIYILQLYLHILLIVSTPFRLVIVLTITILLGLESWIVFSYLQIIQRIKNIEIDGTIDDLPN